MMGGACNKGPSPGEKKLQKLNIRTFSQKKANKIASGPDEIPYYEKQYEKYDVKQLAKECTKLQTDLKGLLDRLSKVESSLNAKKEEQITVNQRIQETEDLYQQMNETLQKLLKGLLNRRDYLKENHVHETNKEEKVTVPFRLKDVRVSKNSSDIPLPRMNTTLREMFKS